MKKVFIEDMLGENLAAIRSDCHFDVGDMVHFVALKRGLITNITDIFDFNDFVDAEKSFTAKVLKIEAYGKDLKFCSEGLIAGITFEKRGI